MCVRVCCHVSLHVCTSVLSCEPPCVRVCCHTMCTSVLSCEPPCVRVCCHVCTCIGTEMCVQHSEEDPHSENGVSGVTMHTVVG